MDGGIKEIAVLKNDLCPICFNKRGAFDHKQVEGICEACVLRMMFAFDHTVKGGSVTIQHGACFCCHRQVEPDVLYGGACLFCRRAGLRFLGAYKTRQKINKQHVPAYPPVITSRKEGKKFHGNPLEYLDMCWEVPADTEWRAE